jgi:hypothetical protein
MKNLDREPRRHSAMPTASARTCRNLMSIYLSEYAENTLRCFLLSQRKDAEERRSLRGRRQFLRDGASNRGSDALTAPQASPALPLTCADFGAYPCSQRDAKENCGDAGLPIASQHRVIVLASSCFELSVKALCAFASLRRDSFVVTWLRKFSPAPPACSPWSDTAG